MRRPLGDDFAHASPDPPSISRALTYWRRFALLGTHLVRVSIPRSGPRRHPADFAKFRAARPFSRDPIFGRDHAGANWSEPQKQFAAQPVFEWKRVKGSGCFLSFGANGPPASLPFQKGLPVFSGGTPRVLNPRAGICGGSPKLFRRPAIRFPERAPIKGRNLQRRVQGAVLQRPPSNIRSSPPRCLNENLVLSRALSI